jgi:hypothetical protein
MIHKLFNEALDKCLIEIRKDQNKDKLRKIISPFLDYTVNYSIKIAYPYILTIILILILFIILLILTLYNINSKLAIIRNELNRIVNSSI